MQAVLVVGTLECCALRDIARPLSRGQRREMLASSCGAVLTAIAA